MQTHTGHESNRPSAPTRLCVYALTHMHTHTHTHANTHTHTHTHTHKQDVSQADLAQLRVFVVGRPNTAVILRFRSCYGMCSLAIECVLLL
jgi:ABC-type nickel/cobalt efflux system permease component RcnA